MLGMNVEKLNNQHLDKSNVIEIHLVPTPTREKARYSSCHLNSFTRFLCQGDKASFWDNSDLDVDDFIESNVIKKGVKCVH